MKYLFTNSTVKNARSPKFIHGWMYKGALYIAQFNVQLNAKSPCATMSQIPIEYNDHSCIIVFVCDAGQHTHTPHNMVLHYCAHCTPPTSVHGTKFHFLDCSVLLVHGCCWWCLCSSELLPAILQINLLLKAQNMRYIA